MSPLNKDAPILIVEDDPDIVKIVQAYLGREGYAVEVATDGVSGLEKALTLSPRLVVLDWMLPHLDGLEFLRRLRLERPTPVIMLTAKGEEPDRLAGFAAGVDDYVPKPFSPRELVARVQAVLRRGEASADVRQTIQQGALEIDLDKRTARLDGNPLELTTLEFDLLVTLASQPGRVFRRNDLLSRVWGEDFLGVDRVVDVHVSNLRQKLEQSPNRPTYLLTVRGVGYKFNENVL